MYIFLEKLKEFHMMKKFIALIAVSSLAFFAACGDDSSSSPAENNDDSEITSADSKAKSSDSKKDDSKAKSSSSMNDDGKGESSDSKKDDGKAKSSDSKNDDGKAKSSSSVKDDEGEDPISVDPKDEGSDEGDKPASSSSEAKIEVENADAASEFDAEEGTLKDLRDGQTYKTAKIGDQIWMVENLNYEYVGGTFCKDDEFCKKYGRHYSWGAAMDSLAVFSDDGKGCGALKKCEAKDAARGICPKGWHVPTQTDMETLIEAAGGEDIAGKKLKSAEGWEAGESDASYCKPEYEDEDSPYWEFCSKGSDTFGFSALGTGEYDFYKKKLNEPDSTTSFWTSTQMLTSANVAHVYVASISYEENSIFFDHSGHSSDGFSVRCIKDDE